MEVTSERRAWELHWRELSGSRRWFGSAASLVRRQLLSRAVRFFTDRYFQPAGWFLEAGCGSGESASRLRAADRRLVGLDYSLAALARAAREGSYRFLVCGDIQHMPVRDGALQGVWNLGVMEHFPEDRGIAILRELRRVLAGGGIALLFWPPVFGLSRWVLAPFEAWQSRRLDRRVRFFPDEVNRLRSPGHGRRLLVAASLTPVRVHFSPREGFNQLVVVARKDGP